MAQIKGIKEIMICTYDLEKEDLAKLTSIKLKEIINNKLQESSQLLYVYDEYGFDTDSALSIEVCYEEIDSTPVVQEGMVRLVFWQELEQCNVNADLNELSGNVTLNLKGNTYGCMSDWGYQSFEFITSNDGTELFLESESYGDENKTIYFLNSKKECAYSINDIDNNITFDEEFEEMKKDYCN